MRERAQFPCSEMCGHEDDAAAPAQSCQIVFKAVVNDVLRNIAFVQFRKVCELHKQSSEIVKTSSQDAFPLAIASIGVCLTEIMYLCVTLPASMVKYIL